MNTMRTFLLVIIFGTGLHAELGQQPIVERMIDRINHINDYTAYQAVWAAIAGGMLSNDELNLVRNVIQAKIDVIKEEIQEARKDFWMITNLVRDNRFMFLTGAAVVWAAAALGGGYRCLVYNNAATKRDAQSSVVNSFRGINTVASREAKWALEDEERKLDAEAENQAYCLLDYVTDIGIPLFVLGAALGGVGGVGFFMAYQQELYRLEKILELIDAKLEQKRPLIS